MRTTVAALLAVLLLACSGGDGADVSEESDPAVTESADAQSEDEAEEAAVATSAPAEGATATPTPTAAGARGELSQTRPAGSMGSLMGGADLETVEDPTAVISCSAAELLVTSRDRLDAVSSTATPEELQVAVEGFSTAVDIASAAVLDGPLTDLAIQLRDSLDDVIAYLQSEGFDASSIERAPPEVQEAVARLVEATEGLIAGLGAGCPEVDQPTEPGTAAADVPSYCSVLLQLQAILDVENPDAEATFIAVFAVLDTALESLGGTDPAATDILLGVSEYFAFAESVIAEYDYDLDAAESDPRLQGLDDAPVQALVELVQANCPPESLGG